MHDGKRLTGRRAGTRRAGCPVPPGSGPARRQAAGLAPVVLRRACWKKTTIAGTGSHDVAGMLAHGEDPLVESHVDAVIPEVCREPRPVTASASILKPRRSRDRKSTRLNSSH